MTTATHTPTNRSTTPVHNPDVTEDTVIGSHWFNPMGGALIGIVMVDTAYDGIVFYIGTGVGVSQPNDERRIMQTGARFPWHVGMQMFGREIEEAK